MESITVEEMMALSRTKLIARGERWIKEMNGGKLMKVKNPSECPLAVWVAVNHKKCHKEMVPNTANCPLCGNPMCPDCYNHVVEQLSRVTGYLSTVSGWNEAKKQEFEDRTRYDV